MILSPIYVNWHCLMQTHPLDAVWHKCVVHMLFISVEMCPIIFHVYVYVEQHDWLIILTILLVYINIQKGIKYDDILN